MTSFRKQHIMPTEHGSWAWLLVPLLVGAFIPTHLSPAIGFILSGSLALFLLRQPAILYLRVRQGKANPHNGRPALLWLIALAIVGCLSLLGLLTLQRTAPLWLIPPTMLLLVLYLVIAQTARIHLRALWLELLGAATLALTAPAALLTAQPTPATNPLTLWLILAAQNALGALYVRLRIYQTHQKAIATTPVFLAHLVVFLLILVAGFVTAVPWATAVPFAFFLLRTIIAIQAPRPIPNIKRFGFTELGFELFSGLIFIFVFRSYAV